MSRRAIGLVLIVCLVVSATGCATLFKSKTAVLQLNSDPEGADVYLNGNRIGRTPLPFKVSHTKPVTISFRKQGYEDKTYIINTKIGAGWIILDCFGGFLAVIIDACTGNWYSLEETEVNALFEVKRK